MSKYNKPTSLSTLALFCKVVDNYGDIGICWRLARQLQHEHHIQVQLWVDDLKSFQRICPEVEIALEQQKIQGVEVRWWNSQDLAFTPADIADIVIEFFACDIPPDYITAMSQCEPRPVWFNLEGLTAEDWVEGCHRLPSSHPRLPLTKYFFFPGFNQKTGGLMFESGLEAARQAFVSSSLSCQDFLRRLGAEEQDLDAFKISLFCYPHAPIQALLETWASSDQEIFLLVPEGVANASLTAFFGHELSPSSTAQRGNLRARSFPFIAQDDYDRLLWACDFNFVRGEDSFVRAQWATAPFIWHIYPQDENLHHKKLRAFLSIYEPGTEALRELFLAWNEVIPTPDWPRIWNKIYAEHAQFKLETQKWANEKRLNGDLSANLLRFAQEIREKSL